MLRSCGRALLSAMLVSATLPAWADMALADAKNCMTCHAMDKKKLGPAYKEVAARYKGDSAAIERLATKIRMGGGGVWGNAVMPSNPQVSEAESKKIAAWILGL